MIEQKSVFGLHVTILETEEYDRMKCCTNCIHQNVCLIVARRKIAKANDYSPCSNWKVIEGVAE